MSRTNNSWRNVPGTGCGWWPSPPTSSHKTDPVTKMVEILSSPYPAISASSSRLSDSRDIPCPRAATEEATVRKRKRKKKTIGAAIVVIEMELR